jgi:hypothetical protein
MGDFLTLLENFLLSSLMKIILKNTPLFNFFFGSLSSSVGCAATPLFRLVNKKDSGQHNPTTPSHISPAVILSLAMCSQGYSVDGELRTSDV